MDRNPGIHSYSAAPIQFYLSITAMSRNLKRKFVSLEAVVDRDDEDEDEDEDDDEEEDSKSLSNFVNNDEDSSPERPGSRISNVTSSINEDKKHKAMMEIVCTALWKAHDIWDESITNILTGSGDRKESFLQNVFADIGINATKILLHIHDYLHTYSKKGIYSDLLQCRDCSGDFIIPDMDPRRTLQALERCCFLEKKEQGFFAKEFMAPYLEDMDEDNNMEEEEDDANFSDDHQPHPAAPPSPTPMIIVDNPDHKQTTKEDESENEDGSVGQPIVNEDDDSVVRQPIINDDDSFISIEDDDRMSSSEYLEDTKIMCFGVKTDEIRNELSCIPYPATSLHTILSGSTLLALVEHMTPLSMDEESLWPIKVMLKHNVTENKRGKELEQFVSNRKNNELRCFCLMSGKFQKTVAYDNRIYSKAKNKIYLPDRVNGLYKLFEDMSPHITSVAACLKGGNAYTAQQTKSRFRLVIDIDWAISRQSTPLTIKGERIGNFFAETISQIVFAIIPSLRELATAHGIVTRVITTISPPHPPFKGPELAGLPVDDLQAYQHLEEHVRSLKVGFHLSFCSLFVTREQYVFIIHAIRILLQPVYQSEANPMVTTGIIPTTQDLPALKDIIDLLQSQNGDMGCSLRDPFTIKTIPIVIRLNGSTDEEKNIAEIQRRFGHSFTTRNGIVYKPDEEKTHRHILQMYRRSKIPCKLSGRRSKNATEIVIAAVRPSLHLPIAIHHIGMDQTSGKCLVINKSVEELYGIDFTNQDLPYARQGELANRADYNVAEDELQILVQAILFRATVAADPCVEESLPEDIKIPQNWTTNGGMFPDILIDKIEIPKSDTTTIVYGDNKTPLNTDKLHDIDVNHLDRPNPDNKGRSRFESIRRPSSVYDGHLMSLIWQCAIDLVPCFGEFLHVTVPRLQHIVHRIYEQYFRISTLEKYVSICTRMLQRALQKRPEEFTNNWWKTDLPKDNILLRKVDLNDETMERQFQDAKDFQRCTTTLQKQEYALQQHLNHIRLLIDGRIAFAKNNVFTHIQSTILMMHTLFREDEQRLKTLIIHNADKLLNELFSESQLNGHDLSEVYNFLEMLKKYVGKCADDISLGNGDMPWTTNGILLENLFFEDRNRREIFREQIRDLCSRAKFEISLQGKKVRIYRIQFPHSLCKSKMRRLHNGEIKSRNNSSFPEAMEDISHGSSQTTLTFNFVVLAGNHPVLVKVEDCRSDKCCQLGSISAIPRNNVGEILMEALCGDENGILVNSVDDIHVSSSSSSSFDFADFMTYRQPKRYESKRRKKAPLAVHDQPEEQFQMTINSIVTRSKFIDKKYYQENGSVLGYAGCMRDAVRTCKSFML